MVIEKVINNNVVTAVDEKNRETVLMGKGIGFQAKQGQDVNEDKIEKRFVADNTIQAGKFAELVQDIPLEHLQVSMEIIEYADSILQKRLSNSIYISLTDHINFAVERVKSGTFFENPLLNEVRSFYPSEYLIGEYAISLIQKKLHVSLPADEAASIAMHFVNAEYNTAMSDTMSITTLIREILELVGEELGTNLDELGIYYSRFVTHLKFAAYRGFSDQPLPSTEDELVELVRGLYAKEFSISQKIADFIKERYDYEIAEEEKAYLTIHIRRIQPGIKSEE